MRNLSRSRVSNKCDVLWCTVVFTFSLLTVAPLFAEQGNAGKPSKEEVIQEIQKLQAPFIVNNGQVDKRVRFYAKTFGGTVFVTNDGEIVYSLPVSKIQNMSSTVIEDPKSKIMGIALKEQLVDGKIGEVMGRAQSVSTVSYFYGNDPLLWKNNISTYNIVDMGEVYTGIGLRLKASGNNVEKLFTVKPGANHEAIKVKLDGAKGLSVNETGELLAETELGPVKFTKPVAYQMIDGKKMYVDCGYWIADCRLWNTKNKPKTTDFTEYTDTKETQIQIPTPVVSKVEPSEFRNPNSKTPSSATHHSSPIYGFQVAQYDKTKDLIIDPLLASTYMGGAYEDYGKSIAVDAGGNVYVAGETLSSDFPTTSGAYDTTRNGNTDVYVLKFNSGLTNLLASTFLGGALNHDNCYSIAVDGSGNVFVAGATYSTDFPTTRDVYDAAGNGRWDVFVSKFNGGLTKLLASTVLGKNSDEYGYSIAVDAGGNVYVAGATYSTNFPATPGAYDTSYNGGYYDAFVSKFNNDLTTLLASTFLGGGSGDYGISITVDGAGNALVTGNTWSKDFPTTTGVYNTVHNGGSDDVFVSKFNSGLTGLLASTFLGGYSNDFGKSITADAGGNVYVTGETVSPNFPTTADAYDKSYNRGFKDAFVSKFNSGLTALSASTLLGGNANDYGKSIAIDAGGNVFVTGTTHSADFPATPSVYDTSANGSSDVFVSKFNSGLTNLLASTYHGGTRSDFGNSIAIDSEGNVYVTGETLSLDFPMTPGAYDTSYFRCEDVFVSTFNANLSSDKANK